MATHTIQPNTVVWYCDSSTERTPPSGPNLCTGTGPHFAIRRGIQGKVGARVCGFDVNDAPPCAATVV